MSDPHCKETGSCYLPLSYEQMQKCVCKALGVTVRISVAASEHDTVKDDVSLNISPTQETSYNKDIEGNIKKVRVNLTLSKQRVSIRVSLHDCLSLYSDSCTVSLSGGKNMVCHEELSFVLPELEPSL